MPKKILAISFKKDAADNLKKRIISRYGEQYKDRFISLTYDAFFKSILDRFYRALPDANWCKAPMRNADQATPFPA